MLSLVKPHHYYQALLSQGFGVGIGSGLVFLPALALPSHYFRKRRGVAMGVMISCKSSSRMKRSVVLIDFFQGGSFGGVIYSILLNKILPREDWGFPWAVRCVHCFCVARNTS
jgi:MFS family permease